MKAAVLLALTLSACGGHALAPDGPGGAAGSSTGAAGVTGTAGTVTTTGAAGAGATTGAAGAASVRTPLPIPGSDAVERIAALLWHQPADAATIAAASALETKEDLEPIVRQMLADPRAAEGVGAFFRWWLDLDQVTTVEKDPSLFPTLTPQLRVDMVNETVAFGDDTTLNEGALGTYTTLLTASWSFLNERLAALLYGNTGGVIGDQLRRTDLPAGYRAGILTQASLQMLGSFKTRTSPSHRGSQIIQKFFCEAVPPPPPNLEMTFTPKPGETTRQALAASIAQGGAACRACHDLFDGPGLAFESYDAIGGGRTVDNGAPVDTSNIELDLPGDDLGMRIVQGPIDLALTIAESGSAQDCYAQQWLTFALGRELSTFDQPSLRNIQARFKASNLDLQTLIVSVLLSDTFLTGPA